MVKGERETEFFVFIRHTSPMVPTKAVVESLKESADPILICIGPREDYDGFAEIEGRASCPFIFC